MVVIPLLCKLGLILPLWFIITYIIIHMVKFITFHYMTLVSRPPCMTSSGIGLHYNMHTHNSRHAPISHKPRPRVKARIRS